MLYEINNYSLLAAGFFLQGSLKRPSLDECQVIANSVWQYDRVGKTGENREYIVEFIDKLNLEIEFPLFLMDLMAM